MKKTITKAEHLQLVGLKTLANKHNNMLQDIRSSVQEIIGDSESSLSSGDLVYDTEHTVESMLKNLSIVVEDAN